MDGMTDPAPGAAGTDPKGGPAPTNGEPQNTPANGQPAPGAPKDQPAKPAKTDLETLPQDVRDLIAELRTENAKHRTDKQSSAQAAEQAKRERAQVLKAYGLTEDGSEEPLSEDQLNERINEANDAAWAMGVENVLLRNKAIDTEKLLDSRKFLNSLDDKGFNDRDPREKDFAADLGKHVAKYVEDHPEYAAKPPGATRSGGDHPGGPAAPRKRPGLHAAVSNALKSGGGS